MNFSCKSLKTGVRRREMQKEPNSQHTLLEEQLLLKTHQKLLLEAFSLFNLQKIYTFFLQDGKYSVFL